MSARNAADFHGLTAHAADTAMAANVGTIVAACIAAADAVIVAADALRRALPLEDASCPGHPLP